MKLTISETALLKAVIKGEISKNTEFAERSFAHGYDHREWIRQENQQLEGILRKLDGLDG